MMKTTSWLVAVACWLTASLAFGGSGKAFNVVLIVEGADADTVRREVSETLPPRITIVEGDATRAALSTQGIMGNFVDALANQRVRKQALGAIHKSLKQQGAPALIAVRGKPRGRNGVRELRVVMVSSEQVEPIVEENVAIGKNEKTGSKVGALLSMPLEDVEATSEKAVAAAPPKTAPAAEPPAKRAPVQATKEPATKEAQAKESESAKEEPVKDEPAVSAAADVSTRDAASRKKRERVDFGNALIIAEAAGEVGARKLEYSDPLRGPLRSYLAPGVVGYAFGAQFYPGASSGIAFAKDIGVVGRYAGSLGFESKTLDGSQKATGSWTRSAVGLRGRIHTGAKADSPLIGLEGTYGNWAFVFEGDEPIVSEVPSVQYKYLRVAADARVPFGAATLFGGAGYMQILSAGEYSDRFPNATIAGVDGHVGVGYAFLPWLEARGEIDYTRVFSSAKPKLGDTYVAGGALDQYFVWHFGVAAAF